MAGSRVRQVQRDRVAPYLVDVLCPQMERPLKLGNVSRVQEFILLGLSTRPYIRDILFSVFLSLYLLTLLENTLIIYLIYNHTELHTRIRGSNRINGTPSWGFTF